MQLSPNKISENLQKNVPNISGIWPCDETEYYLSKALNKINLWIEFF